VSKVGKRQSMHGEEGKRYIDKDLMIELLVTIAISQTNLSSAYSDSQYESYFIKILFMIEKVHFSAGLKHYMHR